MRELNALDAILVLLRGALAGEPWAVEAVAMLACILGAFAAYDAWAAHEARHPRPAPEPQAEPAPHPVRSGRVAVRGRTVQRYPARRTRQGYQGPSQCTLGPAVHSPLARALALDVEADPARSH